jgi:hypothetical protein
MSNKNIITISDRDRVAACTQLRAMAKGDRIRFVDRSLFVDLVEWTDPRYAKEPVVDFALQPDEAHVALRAAVNVFLGEFDNSADMRHLRDLCPNADELHCEFTDDASVRNVFQIFGDEIRRLVATDTKSKLEVELLDSFKETLESFESRHVRFNPRRDAFQQTADQDRVRYWIGQCPNLRHVRLPFDFVPWGVDPRDREYGFNPAVNTTTLSFVQRAPYTDNVLTSFLKPAAPSPRWVWSRVAPSIAFLRVNAGHPLRDSGVTIGGGLIQMIAAFQGPEDDAQDVAQEFGLECKAVDDHVAEVKAAQTRLLPRVEKIVFVSKFGRSHWLPPSSTALQMEEEEEEDDDCILLDAPPPSRSRVNNKRKHDCC